jgi:DNA (cytosine-5)-methyltransferase 1
MPAAKLPLPVIPPSKSGIRRIVAVDSFAGAGGASGGIKEAFHRLAMAGLLPFGHPMGPTYAINHDEPALIMHEINYPDTIHLRHNVWQVRMQEVLGDDLFGFLWLSPDCRDHSSAKGGPITSRAVRDLAWVLIKWLKELPDWQRPWTICLENVGAFAKWSPLIERPDGKGFMRDPDRIGHTFHQFVHALSRFGYSVGWGEMVACEHGDPTIRKRLKLCARRDGQRIVFPRPTHGDPKSEAVVSGRLKPWPVAADIIDFSLPCPSVLMTKEEARAYTKSTGQKIIRPLAMKTDARLAKGVKRHVIDAAAKGEAFIVTCNHAGDGFRGQGMREPLKTVAAARDAHGLVVPHLMTMRNSAKPTSAANEPTHTATAAGAHLFDVETTIAPFLSRGQHGGGNRPANVPHTTIAASDGDQNQVVVPYLVPRYGERAGQEPRSFAIDRPAPTPVPDGNGGSLAAVYLAQHNGGSRGPIGRGAAAPLSTVETAGSQQQIVAAHMLSLKGSDRRDGSCEAPHPAVCAGGQHSALITLPLMTAYYSTGGQSAAIGDPMLAVPTKARFGLTHVDAAPQPLTDAQLASARRVAAFLRKHGCWDGGDIVTIEIEGITFVIVDIGMRMLTPRELARANGFPESFFLDPIWKGKPLSETQQRHKIGNAVCRLPAAAFIEANYRPPLEWGQKAFLEAAE